MTTQFFRAGRWMNLIQAQKHDAIHRKSAEDMEVVVEVVEEVAIEEVPVANVPTAEVIDEVVIDEVPVTTEAPIALIEEKAASLKVVDKMSYQEMLKKAKELGHSFAKSPKKDELVLLLKG